MSDDDRYNPRNDGYGPYVPADKEFVLTVARSQAPEHSGVSAIALELLSFRDRIGPLQAVAEGSAPASDALDAIAKACGCPEWEYPGQVVRDVKALAAELVAARKSGRAWKALAKGYKKTSDSFRASAARATNALRKENEALGDILRERGRCQKIALVLAKRSREKSAAARNPGWKLAHQHAATIAKRIASTISAHKLS